VREIIEKRREVVLYIIADTNNQTAFKEEEIQKKSIVILTFWFIFFKLNYIVLGIPEAGVSCRSLSFLADIFPS